MNCDQVGLSLILPSLVLFCGQRKHITDLIYSLPPCPQSLLFLAEFDSKGTLPISPNHTQEQSCKKESPRNSLFLTRNKADLNRARKSSVSGYFQLLPLIHELSPVRHPQCSHGCSEERSSPIISCRGRMVPTGNKEGKVYKTADTWTILSRNSLGSKEENKDHFFPFFK